MSPVNCTSQLQQHFSSRLTRLCCAPGAVNKTFVNNQRIEPHVWKPLSDGDVLSLGGKQIITVCGQERPNPWVWRVAHVPEFLAAHAQPASALAAGPARPELFRFGTPPAAHAGAGVAAMQPEVYSFRVQAGYGPAIEPQAAAGGMSGGVDLPGVMMCQASVCCGHLIPELWLLLVVLCRASSPCCWSGTHGRPWPAACIAKPASKGFRAG